MPMQLSRWTFFGLLWLFFGCNMALADSEADSLAQVQQQFQATFTQMNILDFQASAMPGLYEIINADQIIYFYPEKELLFLGQIFNKQGHNLTQEKLTSIKSAQRAKLDLSVALEIGDPTATKTLIEFTDPNCGYCQQFHHDMQEKTQVKRQVIFSPFQPGSAQKVVHILCSDHPEQAYHAIFNGQVDSADLLDCQQGQDLLKKHQQISSAFGVQGTPTLSWEGRVITGYQKARVAHYINSN